MPDRWRGVWHSPRKEHILFLVLGFCILTLLNCCRDRGTRWGGRIEEINGLVVVQNPPEPMSRHAALTLNEDLSIGRADAGEEYLFSDISGLDVSDEGHIYVINRPDANVRIYDIKGIFLRTIGRKGQGPGEMEMPLYIQVQVGAGQDIFVFDYIGARGLYFSPDGAFLRQQHSRGTFMPVRMNSQGQLIGMEILAPPPLGGKVLRTYDADLQPRFEIAKEEQGSNRIFDIGRPACYCAVKPDDSIVWGDSREYVLHILDPEGRRIRKITKPYDPSPISNEDRESINKRYADAVRHGMKVEFRSHYPAFGGIFVDDAGRILVKTYEREKSENAAFYFDVFDPSGRFYAKVPIKANLDRFSVWKNGKLYAQERDPEGFPLIKRYNVIWSDGMR